MKAIVLNDFGGVENLEIRDIPKPLIGEREVLIQVKAISINPVDVKIREQEAGISEILKPYNPMILGWDVSGIIVEVGKAVKDFKEGDEVFGMINFPGHGKAYAEYVAAPASQLALKPKNISHEEAAAATLAALTAWQAFTRDGHLNVNDRILIHAASGGVGHYAVQIAKYLGAYVIGTSSAANKDFVMGLGVDEHIDYKNQRFENVATNIEFILESIGGDNFDRSVNLINYGGTIVVLPSGLNEVQEQKAKDKNLKACFFMTVESNGDDMKIIADLLERRIIRSHVSKVFDFEDMADAHLYMESGRTVGKIVLKL